MPTRKRAAAEATDRNAIMLLLAYVEAECRRLGAEDAARHAAIAAELMPTIPPSGVHLN
ncbi:hypothetical protein ACVFYP_01630 [Roseomonas sp. F4]